jgi:Bacterial SH3 domain
MKLTKILVAIIAPLITLVPQVTPIANAQSDSEIVRGRCNVDVIGLEEGSRVNMRSAPRVKSDIVGYVLVGQRVNQLRYSIGAAVIDTDTQGAAWSYVEYIPSGTRGWISRDFLGRKCSTGEGAN